MAAVGVALFPTTRPDDLGIRATPLQEKLGENFVGFLHFVFAVVFVASLAVISYFFGRREAERNRSARSTGPRMSPDFWRNFHYTAATLIVAAIVYMAVTKIAGVGDEHSLLIGETVAAWSFGTSWLAKGLELDVLLGRGAG